MKSIGNEKRQSLRKRVRAVLLSGVLTATLVLSNMAGIFTEAVYADEPEEVRIGSGVVKTSDIRDQAGKIIRVSNGETTLNIDADLTINKLIIDNNVSKFTITGDNEHTLRFSKIYNNDRVDLIINSGKLVSHSDGIFLGNNIVINGGTVEVDSEEMSIYGGNNVTINGGTVKVNAKDGNAISGRGKVTISGGTVKAVSVVGVGLEGDGGVEITGGNIEAKSSANYAIAAWGNINISGRSTVVKAVANAGNSAIQAYNNGKINISSPLKITSPKGGGISGDGTFIATKARGNQTAPQVEIRYAASDNSIKIKSFKLNMTKAIMTAKQQIQLSMASVTPSNATNTELSWSTSKPSVATVSSNGVVTCVGTGNCKITAMTTDGSKKKATVSITGPKKASSVSLKASVKKVAKDGLVTIKATVKPNRVIDDSVKWESLSNNFKFVKKTAKSCTIRCTGAGNLKVRAVSVNGSKKRTITITGPKKVTGVSLKSSKKSLALGETAVISATVNPKDAIDRTVKWKPVSANVEIIKSDGKKCTVKCKGEGNVKVKAISKSGDKKKTITIKGPHKSH